MSKMPLPQQVGPYNIESIISKGAFGVVYQATYRDSGTRVALKAVNKNFAASRNMSTQIRREITIMKQLKHPHVVAVRSIVVKIPPIYHPATQPSPIEINIQLPTVQKIDGNCNRYLYCHGTCLGWRAFSRNREERCPKEFAVEPGRRRMLCHTYLYARASRTVEGIRSAQVHGAAHGRSFILSPARRLPPQPEGYLLR